MRDADWEAIVVVVYCIAITLLAIYGIATDTIRP